MINEINDYLPITGQFYLANKGTRTMMIGVINGEYVSKENDGEIWDISFSILKRKRYKCPESFKNKRADQILTISVPIKDLEVIKGSK